jgi:hypothetical protein
VFIPLLWDVNVQGKSIKKIKILVIGNYHHCGLLFKWACSPFITFSSCVVVTIHFFCWSSPSSCFVPLHGILVYRVTTTKNMKLLQVENTIMVFLLLFSSPFTCPIVYGLCVVVLVIIIVMFSMQVQINKEHNTSHKVKIVIKYLKWTCSPCELYRLLLIVCALKFVHYYKTHPHSNIHSTQHWLGKSQFYF